MKNHILSALREQFARWEALLASIHADQMTTPLRPPDWTIKDEIAHLNAWQQRSIANIETALHNHAPDYPRWSAEQDLDSEENTDQINEWIYEFYRPLNWNQAYQDWKTGFQRILDSAGQVSERDLLDSGRYPQLKGYPLALILLSCYDHHQEHLEKLEALLSERGVNDLPA